MVNNDYLKQIIDFAPLSNAQAAFAIINKWASILKDGGNDVTLDILNKTFPIECNPYYERGQRFKHLFYEVASSYSYDGEKADGPVQGNWDFDKKRPLYYRNHRRQASHYVETMAHGIT